MAQITFLARVYAKLRAPVGRRLLVADEFAELWKQAWARRREGPRGSSSGGRGDHTGALSAWCPTRHPQALAVDGGLAPEQLHLTLCLFGDTSNCSGQLRGLKRSWPCARRGGVLRTACGRNQWHWALHQWRAGRDLCLAR